MLVGSITVFQLSLHPWRYSVETNDGNTPNGQDLAPLFDLERELWRTSADRHNLLSLLHYLAQHGYMLDRETTDTSEDPVPPRYLFAARFLQHFACAVISKRLRLARRIKTENLIPLSTLKDNLTADFTRIMPRSLATQFRSALDSIHFDSAEGSMHFALREYDWINDHIKNGAIEPPLPIGHAVGNVALLRKARMTAGLTEEVLRESYRGIEEQSHRARSKRVRLA